MTSSSDQNLLFGIIALQMDFVRRDQLVAATSTRLMDKSRRVDEILVQQGALSEEDHQVLAPLVARYLENHGGDPQRSLSALSSIGSVAEDLRSSFASARWRASVSLWLDSVSSRFLSADDRREDAQSGHGNKHHR